MNAGFAFRIKEKTQRSLTPYISIVDIVKDYGDQAHDWGLSQDRWKSTSWSMVYPRIVEIYHYHRIEDQPSIVEALSQKFRSRKLHKTS